jgi:hypothetical protein
MKPSILPAQADKNEFLTFEQWVSAGVDLKLSQVIASSLLNASF